jgi:Ca2+-binding EF-hand superfamily protein
MSFRSSRGPLALAAALAIGLAGAAAAQTATDSTGAAGTEGGGDRHQMMFKRIDADGNGSISSQEMESWRSKAVFRLDADSDGKVTKEEVDQHIAQRQAEGGQAPDSAKFFSTYDANGDGAIDEEELKNGGSQRFQTADTDANGELSMEEWTALQGS